MINPQTTRRCTVQEQTVIMYDRYSPGSLGVYHHPLHVRNTSEGLREHTKPGNFETKKVLKEDGIKSEDMPPEQNTSPRPGSEPYSADFSCIKGPPTGPLEAMGEGSKRGIQPGVRSDFVNPWIVIPSEPGCPCDTEYGLILGKGCRKHRLQLQIS